MAQPAEGVQRPQAIIVSLEAVCGEESLWYVTRSREIPPRRLVGMTLPH
jgi:hypothetical protein